jgi:hypothetical protein
MTYDSEQIIAMLRRSYGAVDGLWFVMCEQRLGFEAALDLDDAVWQVMPKLQARQARAVLGLEGESLDELAQALGLKLTAEGHQFEVSQTAERLEVRVLHCPWHEALVKSGRMQIAAQVAGVICANEARGWAAEFGQQAEFSADDSICCGGDCCRFVFGGRAAYP